MLDQELIHDVKILKAKYWSKFAIMAELHIGSDAYNRIQAGESPYKRKKQIYE